MSPSSILASLDAVVDAGVRPHALAVDRDGVFPLASLAALRAAGVLGLGSPVADGGQGGSLGDCAQAVRCIARACASTAMVVTMHLAAARVVAAHGDAAARAGVASGAQLATLAFSEAGSRSHFWAPLSTARPVGDEVRLDAEKSWVTSARHAAWVVWSSRPLSAAGASTLWLVPGGQPGVEVLGAFDGLGLRGNDSAPLRGVDVRVRPDARLGADGEGFAIMMGAVLPAFNLMSAGCALGIAEAAVGAAVAHCAGTRHQHLDQSLAALPTIRASLARMRCEVDLGLALLQDAAAALETARPDATLRVLQSKAVAAEAALSVTARAMRVCGGAAFRKELGVERNLRDAQAASVMAPTTDALYDFIGRALTGMELFA